MGHQIIHLLKYFWDHTCTKHWVKRCKRYRSYSQRGDKDNEINKGCDETSDKRVVHNENWFLLSICSTSFFFLSWLV